MADGFDVSRAVGAGLGDRQRTWDFIAGFAAAWTRPLAPGDGYSEDVLWAAAERLGARLPAALREAYLLFGRRADLTARQDPLVSPDRLRVDHAGAVIMFRSENQFCAQWGVAATDPWNADDPVVYVRRQPVNRPWEPFAGRMSLACAEMVLSEVLLGAKFMDMCELPGELISAAESAYRQVSLPDYPLWYDTAVTSRWFAAPGKLLRMDGRGPHSWLIAAGQTRKDLESVCTAIPGPWQQAGRNWLSPDDRSGANGSSCISIHRSLPRMPGSPALRVPELRLFGECDYTRSQPPHSVTRVHGNPLRSVQLRVILARYGRAAARSME